ncbi:MAG: hypothetical protein JNK88_03885 [Mangrovicoccus sp.]|nr:hypothetical protein [Mangrovicoccus sp.]
MGSTPTPFRQIRPGRLRQTRGTRPGKVLQNGSFRFVDWLRIFDDGTTLAEG